MTSPHAPFTTPEGLRIGCPDIDAQAVDAFKRANNFTDEQVDRLSRYCRGEVEAWR